METIWQYIQFAEKNDWKTFDKFDIKIIKEGDDVMFIATPKHKVFIGHFYKCNIEKILMEKKFLEAIAKGIFKRKAVNKGGIKVMKIGIHKYTNHLGFFEHITILQGAAIRDNELGKYINKYIK